MFQGSYFFFQGSVFGVFFSRSPFASISVTSDSASFSRRPLFRAVRPMYGEGFDAGGYAAADTTPMVQALLSTARVAQQQLEQDATLRQMPQLISNEAVQVVDATPDILDPKQIAANSIKPGCAQWTIKSWDPKDEKPKKEHLLKAMANRILPPGSKPPAPAGWEVQKIADWLKAHGVEGEVQDVTSPAPQLGVGGSPGEDVSPPTASASGGGAPPPPGVDRWSARSHGCRLITLIGTQDDLREGFLRKDTKFSTRTEKDIGDRDSFYVDLANAFNDSSRSCPELFKVKSQLLAEKLRDKKFTCAHSAYVLAPDAAKKHVVAIMGQLRSALARFRQSGQGNCATDEKVREAQDQRLEPGVTEEDSKKVYSSDFQNFCAGMELTAYTYEVFIQYHLLEAASGDMPDASTASSEGASTTQRPACRAGGRGRNKTKATINSIAKSITEAARAPMRLERSANEEEGVRLQNAATKLALKRQVTQDIDDLQTKIDDLEREVRRAKKNGETPPSHQAKLKRWYARIEELEAVATTPPRQSGASSHTAASNVHSLDDSEEEEGESGGEDNEEEEDGEEDDEDK